MKTSKSSLNAAPRRDLRGQQVHGAVLIILAIALTAAVGCKEATLHEAAEAGNRLAIDRHIEKGSDVNALDAHSWTALQLALLHGNEEIIRLLLAHGADPNFSDSITGHPYPLGIAIVNGRKDLVELLLQNGARTDFGKSGSGALDMAALTGQKEILELLLNRAAEPDFQRLLLPAVVSGQTNVVALVLSKGVNIDSKVSQSGETVIFEAVRNKDMAMVRFLVENGATVDVSDVSGSSPAGLASELGEKDIESYLAALKLVGQPE